METPARRPQADLQRRDGRRSAGWWSIALVGPHLLLGTWLMMVPDYRAFLAAQLVTLAHVGLALFAFPLVSWWTIRHVHLYRRTLTLGSGASWSDVVLVGAVLLACLSGAAVLRGGTIIDTARVHAWCGIVVAVPFSWHLWRSGRRTFAAVALGLLVLAAGGSAVGERLLPRGSLQPLKPDFAYKTRPGNLYEPAARCGECHVQEYKDWSRTTHANTTRLGSLRTLLTDPESRIRLDDIGRLRTAPGDSNARPLEVCTSCHAPVAFYGSGAPATEHKSAAPSEGITCSFCHTMREVHESFGPPVLADLGQTADLASVKAGTAYYVSAPETVRQYLGQESGNAFAHQISNWLIRWRPEMHKHDFHSEVLSSSRACLACHSFGINDLAIPHMTYASWSRSPYNTGDPKTTVTCQDCHMATRMTGEQSHFPHALVPWGPVREGGRSHLFLGGNVKAAVEFGEEDYALLEHELNTRALSLAIKHVDKTCDGLKVTVAVHAELLGHHFPSRESQVRYAWVRVSARDSSGKELSFTAPPRDFADFGGPSPLIMSSEDEPSANNDQLIGPRASRDVTALLPLPGPGVSTISAELHESTDPQPFTATSVPFESGSSPDATESGCPSAEEKAPGTNAEGSTAPAMARNEATTELALTLLPAGTFHFGCEPLDTACEQNEKPGKSVTLDAFWIGRTEVTSAAYARCVEAQACTPPATAGACIGNAAGFEHHPVNCVDWDQAQRFCHWIGGALPTAEQWEYAAKGGGHRIYPWGNERPDGTRTNFADRAFSRTFSAQPSDAPDDGWAKTAPVGTYSAGATRQGLLDMTGNVSEWTSTELSDGRLEVRGGSWGTPLDSHRLRITYRVGYPKSYWRAATGFRCVFPEKDGAAE